MSEPCVSLQLDPVSQSHLLIRNIDDFALAWFVVSWMACGNLAFGR